MEKYSKIYIAGHTGLVGSAILRDLQKKGYENLIYRNHQELDLTDKNAVTDFFASETPDYVFLAAAKVGGIEANNQYRADFIYENLMIQTNVIHQSYVSGIKKLMFLGSTCIYPKNAPQPLNEEALLTGELEYTNEPYAIAKIAGFKMCESYNLQYGTNFISVMPTNLFGPNDNFDLKTSHVLPALVRKMHLAKALMEDKWELVREDLFRRPIGDTDGESGKEEIRATLRECGILSADASESTEREVSIKIWGSGKPKREFLWSEDMADACTFLMETVDFGDILVQMNHGEHQEIRNTHINIGTGQEISIAALAFLIKEIIGFHGNLVFDKEKADGTMRKLTDCTKIQKLGWKPSTKLAEGIEKLYKHFSTSPLPLLK